MANIKITDLTAYTDAASTDVLPIVDVGADVTKKITIGNVVKAVPLGTAALPGLAFDGDPNSGVYSPGADQVAISTNGTQRLYIDSTGNIGVGTTTKAWETGQYFAVQFGKGGSVFGRATGDEDRNGFVSNAYATSTGWKYIASSAHATRYDHNDGNHIWYYAGTGTADASVTFSEALRITTTGTLMHIGAGNSTTPAVQFNGSAPVNSLVMDSSGRVGLGTTTPLARLHVDNGASDSFTYLQARGANGLESSLIFLTKTSGGGFSGASIGHDGSTNTLYLTGATTGGSTQHVSIDSSGKVGLGTSDPGGFSSGANNLVVSSASGSSAGITINNQGPDLGSIFFANGTGENAQGRIRYDHSDDSLTISTNTSSAVTIDSSQRVGIGTTTVASAQLYVNSSALYGVRINHATLPLQSFLVNGTQAFTIGANSGGGGSFYYGTGNVEAARIDSSGRLLVGTSSALTGTVSSLSKFVHLGNTGSSSGGGILSIGAGQGVGTLASGDIVGRIFFTDNASAEFASIISQVDGTTGSGDYPGRLVFSTTADSASSPTERLRITSAGVLQVADAGNIAVGTTTGTKIGTATTQKLGFYNATPVVQPAAVADATDAATVITQLNDLLAKLRTLGLIAT